MVHCALQSPLSSRGASFLRLVARWPPPAHLCLRDPNPLAPIPRRVCLEGPGLRTLANGTLATLLTSAVVFVWWSKPGWECTLSQALELQALPAEDRAAYRIAWYLGEPEPMKALDRELGAGDVVAFSEDFGFPSVLWNERFSNSLAYAS